MLLEGIEKEWTHYASELENKNLVSIYIGGGTPSLLHPEEISRLLEPFSKIQLKLPLKLTLTVSTTTNLGPLDQ